jgi:hypothetical protein
MRRTSFEEYWTKAGIQQLRLKPLSDAAVVHVKSVHFDSTAAVAACIPCCIDFIRFSLYHYFGCAETDSLIISRLAVCTEAVYYSVLNARNNLTFCG